MIAVDDITTQAIVDGLDGRCRALDQKWGIGRLRLLVDDDLRARFDLQRKYFNVALANGDEKEIAMHGAGLRRGWDALDAAATAAGAEPLKPEIWDASLATGRWSVSFGLLPRHAMLPVRSRFTPRPKLLS